MERILIAWIGGFDIDNGHDGGTGAIHATLTQDDITYSRAYFLCNYDKAFKDSDAYLDWLNTQTETTLHKDDITLTSPQDFGEIYDAADKLLSQVQAQHPKAQLSIQISPGTPAMQAVWILLGKTKYPNVTFLQSSKEQGVHEAHIPFNISAEFQLGNKLTDLATSNVPTHAAFDDIKTQNADMNRLKQKASVLASHDIPVLINGASGTGKELFATAIHNASERRSQPLQILNCGAIPKELIDSTLFGHKKGAFTGALSDQKGVFEAANGGTLFLDEFGELPLDAQVRLLRVLQEGTLNRVGDSKTIKVDVRLICATNKDLMQAVASGEFREDLFYRIAVGVLNLPPIKERKGDLIYLADTLLEQISPQFSTSGELQAGMNESKQGDKKLSPKAKNIILSHDWPGNVRELHSTLLRACLWYKGAIISEQELTDAMFAKAQGSAKEQAITLDQAVDLQEILDSLEEKYVRLAWQKTNGQKKKAAELLGFSSYQNYNKRLEKYGIK
ncbi:sigma 54-interacting transcriptional regulator [Marinomonas sp. PE14-40]|uniref:sigma-54 interaction domain-containing protein n=1 Tax=Marinomonas sp. PE14-40 TaxID=3060621 RepID=UPI003F6794B3